ncbi:hypothetical protein ABZ858_16930 [Streptomyces sp. NPDC047017]|uniref:hypothetical protein n=1 Tax=Streptomyces sp. NPDC047017 TaxID=3155024 RepID=UPI0033F98B0B
MTERLGDTMNWSRLAWVAVAGLVLCGCADETGSTGTPRDPGTPAHGAHQAASTPAAALPRVTLLLDGQIEARPGQLLGVRVEGLASEQGEDGVTAASPALDGPVRLRWQRYGAFEAAPAVATTAEPGWYPLTVAVAGRVVARDRVQVVRSRRPSFTVSGSDPSRPGERVWLGFDDLFPGERGTGFTVRSAALSGPVRLGRDRYEFHNPRSFTAAPILRTALPDGSYAFDLYGPHGRRVAQKRLTVRAARPGDRDYLGRVTGPDLYAPGTGYRRHAPGHGLTVHRGGLVSVMWHDENPDQGEEGRLTALSPAFTRALRLEADDSKASDGDSPRYRGTATVRARLKPGRYPVTVVSHHGRVRRTSYLTVTAR